MGGYASPSQFDETSDKWPAYQIRVLAFFEGNGLTDDKKNRAMLVAALTTHTADLLSGRCAPDKAVPVMAAARIQRWALLLSAYDYVIKHQPEKDDVPADALSRLPTSATSQPETLEETGDGEYPGVVIPEKLLRGYKLRSRLDNVVAPPGPLARQSSVDRPVPGVLRPGEPVWVRNFGRGEPWIPARITSSDGTRMVNADGPEEENIRHTDQIKPRVGEHDLHDGAGESKRQDGTASPQVVGTPGQGPGIREAAPSTATPSLRRSARTRKPPDRYVP
ncbi:uncharacterized protein LOC144114950 [Amblyomma americanum]